MKHEVVVLNRLANEESAPLPETLVKLCVIGGLEHPCGVAVLLDDGIAVTEWGNSQVSVFTDQAPKGQGLVRTRSTQSADYKKVFCFDTAILNPRAIAMDMQGCLVVTGYAKNKLAVFPELTSSRGSGGQQVYLQGSNEVDLASSRFGIQLPMAVAVNPEDGHLFIASSYTGHVLEMKSRY